MPERTTTTLFPARQLSTAGLLAALRAGAVPHAAQAELLAGEVRTRPLPSGHTASAVVALRLRAAAAVAAIDGAVLVSARPLLRLGPETALRPDLALLNTALLNTAHPTAAHSNLPGSAAAVAHEATNLQPADSVPSAAALLVVEIDVHQARVGEYAAAGVKEAWLLNLRQGYVEVFRSPWAGAYRSRTLWYPGEEVPVATISGLSFAALD